MTATDRPTADEVLAAARAAIAPAWPTLDQSAMQGLAGLVVDNLDPYTEADRAAVLASLLSMAGAYIGAGPHVFAGDAQHPARLWPLLIGPTAGGMKGTAANAVRRVLRAADSIFADCHVAGGLSSGEGLIERVRDASGDPDDKGHDPGVIDKRLLVIESEFAAVLARAKREGNALSPVLRQAWDGGRLSTMTRKASALVATDPHIVVLAHITRDELRIRLAEADLAGGLVNRFLPVLSKRSKRLPDGGGAPDELVTDLGRRLAAARTAAATLSRVKRTPDAEKLWTASYDELTPDNVAEGPVAQVVARAVPQVLRLSLAYALLDRSGRVDVPHLHAALALWRYVEASAEYVFGESTGNRDMDRLARFLETGGLAGRSRDAVSADCFARHKDKAELDALLAAAVATGRFEVVSVQTGGRPVTYYRPARTGEEPKATPSTPTTRCSPTCRPPACGSTSSATPSKVRPTSC